MRIAAGLLLALPSSGCGSRDAKAKERTQPPVAVTVAQASQKDVPVTIEAIGSVEPYRTVSVRARTGGELVRVAFTEGEDVKEGDLLFRIDARPYEAALRSARAALARDRAHAASARAEVDRYADLVEKEYVTRQQYDDVRANATALEATVDADSAEVVAAQLNVEYCTITAPISGRTGNLLVHEGNLVTANGTAPLVVINQLAPVYVSFSAPEQNLSAIRRFASEGTLQVQAIVPSDSGRVVPGDLTFLDNTVDETTGTILLKATFENRDAVLWPGQFVNVRLALTVRRNAVVVPAPAVQTGQNGLFVFVVTAEKTVEMRPVITGPRIDGGIVIEQGLQAEETVVTDGQLRLVPGAKVSLKPPVGEAAGAPKT